MRFVWYETTEFLAGALLACYWSLWDCGSGTVAEGELETTRISDSLYSRSEYRGCWKLAALLALYFGTCCEGMRMA